MNITKLSAYLEEFLASKRAMAEADPHYDAFEGRSLRHKEKLLRNFLAFWQHHGRPWPIRAAHVLDWLAAESHPQHPYRGQHCFYTLRAFLQQVRAFEPGTEVPDKIFKFRRPRRTPHLFSQHEMVLLMRATRHLRLFETFRPLTLRNMIGAPPLFSRDGSGTVMRQLILISIAQGAQPAPRCPFFQEFHSQVASSTASSPRPLPFPQRVGTR